MDIDGSEQSFKNFHAMHPGCCDFGRTDYRSILEKIFGKPIFVYIYLAYRVNVNKNEIYGDYYENFMYMDVCGNYMETGGSGGVNENEFNMTINSKYHH